MAASLESATLEVGESLSGAPERSQARAAIDRCIKAWHRAYNKALEDKSEGKTEYEARQAGNYAYLAAMPPAAGYQNICDFIACVTCGITNDLIGAKKSQRLLGAARTALSLLRHEPKAFGAEKRPVGRPRKSPQPEENK